MKPGSLVVCIDNKMYQNIPCIIPQLEPVVYTVRLVAKCGCGHPKCQEIGLLLEEIRSMVNGKEMMYPAVHFREILPAGLINIEDLFEKEVEA